MDNSILQTQAKMKEFKELSHMLQDMGDIANDERRASTNRTAVVPPTNTSTRPRSDVRCFNCNQEGHIQIDVPDRNETESPALSVVLWDIRKGIVHKEGEKVQPPRIQQHYWLKRMQ
ncbi:hypothetical protein Trydic_g16015 [Trypoxylus dichotomus]